ncbi:MAG: polysaccharide deacetylase [Actinomycetota bacterium]|nr:polysaccharide deacetylase [Actinomycetota bacterium]
MTRRYVTLSLVLILAAITAVLVYEGDHPPSQGVVAAGQVGGVDAGVTAARAGPTGRSAAAAPPVAAPPVAAPPAAAPSAAVAHKASNVPMTKLVSGAKAPQFIIFSFDGAGNHAKWQEFMAAAKPTDARFDGFLTGLYLLTDDNTKKYIGPGHSPGKSSVGFGGTAAEVATRINDLNEAYARGDEIGTHYNGHFCAGAEPSVGVWTTAAWNDEIDQFFGFIANYNRNNPGAKLPRLNVPAASFRGGRTPCLEGQWDQLVPAWKAHGFTFDSSMNNPVSGVNWPSYTDGIWEFYMPYVYSPGFGGMVVNMDYNMWVKFNGGKNQPATAPVLRDKVYQTYTSLYDATYHGNRAPLVIANHFNTWNGNSFNPATLKFMKNYCGRPDTYCTTYSDVIAWMKLQDPQVLAALQKQPPIADKAP